MANSADRLVWPQEGVSRVPYRVFSDPDIFRDEQARIFHGAAWNFVGLEIEVPEKGDFRTHYVGDTPVILTRDHDGGINVLVNRCAHKGNLVSTRICGNVERLTCAYHNWTYDLKGTLKSVAFLHGVAGQGGMPKGFDMAAHGLDRLKVAVYCGLVFASFSEAAPPIEDYLGADMRENIERVLGRDMVLLGYFSQYLSSNWKLYMENTRDPYHASLLHPFQATFRISRLSMDGGVKLSERGWHHISYAKAATDREEAQYNAADLHAIHEGYRLNDPSLLDQWPEYECGTTLAIQTIFPNLVMQQIVNTIALRLCLPKGPGEAELLWWVLGCADDSEEQRAMRLKQTNMIGPAGLISLEDGVVTGWVQRAVSPAPDACSVLEMGGTDVAPSEGSRATEASIRGFWNGYRNFMAL